MLSKSAARWFFVGGTVLFSGVFLGLTVDTLSRVPDQTRETSLTDAARRGKDLWDQNNCMGCHTLMGEGAYYAPELTKVYERRGPAWMKVFLKDPAAMFPGQRQMVNYHFKDDQIDDLVAFFKWIGEADLNGFPPKPTFGGAAYASANSAAAPAGTAAAAHPQKFGEICTACHSLGGTGGNVGPALDKVGTKYDAAWFDKWLANPQAVKPGTLMPQLPLTDAERQELVAFLVSQKGG